MSTNEPDSYDELVRSHTGKPTQEYLAAKRLCDLKASIEVYQSWPLTPFPVVRVRYEDKGTEFGLEFQIRPYENISIGTAIDLAISRLLQKD